MTWLKNLLLNKYITSIIRHGLNALGAYLITAGVLSEDTATSLITEMSNFLINGLPAWIALVWSLIDKKSKS